MIAGAAKAFPTECLRRLFPALVSASVDSRYVQSSGKPSNLAASVGLMTRTSFSSCVCVCFESIASVSHVVNLVERYCRRMFVVGPSIDCFGRADLDAVGVTGPA